MRAEHRGGGLRQRATDTRPDTERTLSVATHFRALHSVGVRVPWGQARKRPAFRDSGRRESMGFYAHPIGDDLNWEPDGATLQVRFCEDPGTNCRMAEIVWHRRETRRQQRTPTSAYPVVRTRLTPRIFNPWPRRVSAAHSTADPDRRGTSDYNGSQSANQHRGPLLLETEGR